MDHLSFGSIKGKSSLSRSGTLDETVVESLELLSLLFLFSLFLSGLEDINLFSALEKVTLEEEDQPTQQQRLVSRDLDGSCYTRAGLANSDPNRKQPLWEVKFNLFFFC